MSPDEFAATLLRTTGFTCAAAAIAELLLRRMRCTSPGVHRAAWLLVILQGWCLAGWSFERRLAVVAAPNIVAPSLATSVMAPQPVATTAAFRNMDANTPALPQSASKGVARWPIIIWFLGAIAVVMWKAWGFSSLVRQLPMGSSPDEATHAQWRRELNRCRVRTEVQLRMTRDLGPMLCYVPFRYVVFAPRTLWTALSSPQRSAILRHELAHLVRRDLWKSLAIRLLALPQWFNPLVWRAVRRFDEAGEWACDDAASGPDRTGSTDYAAALLRAAEWAQPEPIGVAQAGGGRLARRIERLVDLRFESRFKEESKMKRFGLVGLLVAMAAVQLVRVETVAADVESDDAATVAASALAEQNNVETEQQPTEAAVEERLAGSAIDQREQLTPAHSLPRYVIEPPDVLLVEAIRLVPRTDRIATLSGALVRVRGESRKEQVDDIYSVHRSGWINFGSNYGRVNVSGHTAAEARETIRKHLSEHLNNVRVRIPNPPPLTVAQITGHYVVQPDGFLTLNGNGRVTSKVAGKTIDEVKDSLEKHLAQWYDEPEIHVSVAECNSKVYYILTKNDDGSDNALRMPLTGSETVREAIARIGGVSQVPSTRIWIARPGPNGVDVDQILPVNWDAIRNGAETETNYQLMPGDRLFIGKDEADESQPRPWKKIGEPTPVQPPAPVQQIQPPTRIDGSIDPSAANPYAVHPRPDAPPALQSRNQNSVQFEMMVVEDLGDNLSELLCSGSEIEGRLTSSLALFDDVEALRATIRILQKNKLVQVISAPSVVAPLGQTAYVGIGQQAEAPAEGSEEGEFKTRLVNGVSATVLGKRSAGQTLQIDLQLRIVEDEQTVEIDTGLKCEPGQTMLLGGLPARPGRTNPNEVGLGNSTYYFIMTPDYYAPTKATRRPAQLR